jgi:hypothetical protein
LFFTISVPVEVVFAQHTLHAGAAGYGGLLSAWGGGAVAGAAVYARWRGLPSRELIVLGAAALGAGFLVMAVSPTIAVALVGAAVAGVGNGIEAVAARTALQELVEERWMALMMSLNDSLFQCVPGAGILLGGALTALGSPRTALAVAGVGSLLVTGVAWFALAPLAAADGLPDRLGSHRSGPDPGNGAEAPDPDPDSGEGDDPLHEAAPAPVGRHQ